MKLTLDKDKVLSALKGAGAVVADDKTAEAVYAAVDSMLPDGEFYTSDEVDEKLHETREEAKNRRQLIENLVEKITGKKRDEFEQENRTQKMLDEAEAKISEANGKIEQYEKEYEPIKSELDEYRQQKEQSAKENWQGISEKLTAILSDEKAGKFKEKFVLPAEGKELTVDDMQKNVATFNELQEMGVPQFTEKEQNAESPNHPSNGGEKTYKGRNREEYDKFKASQGLL